MKKAARKAMMVVANAATAAAMTVAIVWVIVRNWACRRKAWPTRLGESGGREVHEMACGIGQMRESTGISLAVGTLMLARGEITTEEGGAYGPEACLDPVEFLASLKERGIIAYYDLEMTKLVV